MSPDLLATSTRIERVIHMLTYYYIILILDLAALDMSMICLTASLCLRKDMKDHPEAYLTY